VSKNAEAAIKKTGVKPDHKLVEKMAANTAAYRQERREAKGTERDSP
jgi:hypothetical protein